MNLGVLGLDPGFAGGTIFDPYLDDEAYACLQSRQTPGTGGGGSTGGTTNFDLYPMNTIVEDDSGLILAQLSTGFVVREGKYRCRGMCAMYAVDSVKFRLFNVRESAVLASSQGYCANNRGTSCLLLFEDVFTLRGDRELRLQTASATGSGAVYTRGMDMGGGYASGGDLYEMNAALELWRLRDA